MKREAFGALMCLVVSTTLANAQGNKLLLSEAVVTPTAGEMVEIYNPTSATVDLTNYYVTDATFQGGSVFYYNIVTGASAGGGGFADWHARFPTGAMIGPGEVQTISLNGSMGFMSTYGILPTYELFEDDMAADGVPDMLEALPGSINNQGGLTNSGEFTALYHWDGSSDLVQDVDYLIYADTGEAVDKTGVMIDGPDPDSSPSTYLPDTPLPMQDPVPTHSGGFALNRVDFTEGLQIPVGGNGIFGSNETSENLSVTWSSDQAPTPGFLVPEPSGLAALLLAMLSVLHWRRR